MPRFDAIIIGAGQAGPPLAGRLTSAGMTVALVERHLFGGTCVNTGCMPTKTLVASAEAAHVARRAADFGVVLDGPVRVDMKKVKARAQTVVKNAREGVEKWVRGMKGCTVLTGAARFDSAHEVRVGDELLSADKIFINVGRRAIVPPGLDGVPFLTNTTILDVDVVPRRLIVLGGSYIGLEYAQMYRRFGAEVTVLERGARLVPREDEDVSACVREILEHEGIDIVTNAQPAFAKRGDDVEVTLSERKVDVDIIGSHLLVAIGRIPNTADLGLDRAGVAVDKHGYVIVDDKLATNVPGIWAMGDCNGRGAFTHTSYNDFEIVAANLLDGKNRKLSDRIACYAMYIDPPLARVGLSAGQARAQGKRIRTGRRPMTRVGRATEKDERQGFMEIVVDAASDAILGATILGTGGDEAIHAIIDMMANGATAKKLTETMHIHPTVAELLPTIAGELGEPS